MISFVVSARAATSSVRIAAALRAMGLGHRSAFASCNAPRVRLPPRRCKIQRFRGRKAAEIREFFGPEATIWEPPLDFIQSAICLPTITSASGRRALDQRKSPLRPRPCLGDVSSRACRAPTAPENHPGRRGLPSCNRFRVANSLAVARFNVEVPTRGFARFPSVAGFSP